MKPPGNTRWAIAVAFFALCAVALSLDSPPSRAVYPAKAETQTTVVKLANSTLNAYVQTPTSARNSPQVPKLITVSISPEARVKATAKTGRRDLQLGVWTEFVMEIENAAGVTAPLVVESEQLMTAQSDTARDHWLQLIVVPAGALTGAPQETRAIRLLSRDVGIRTAILNINAGQGTQDLGFRSDVVLSFRIKDGNR